MNSLYCGFGILMDFLFQMSLFAGMAVYYTKWEHKKFVEPHLPVEKEPVGDESRPDISKSPKGREMKSSLMNWWGHTLLGSWISKALVIAVFAAYLAISIWAATDVETSTVLCIPSSIFFFHPLANVLKKKEFEDLAPQGFYIFDMYDDRAVEPSISILFRAHRTLSTV